ncbi:hypothetical protein CR66_05630 [Campylobacter mucosalis]|uniref:rhodanese-like domain-containing protein n=1 Tax=Campylobacter mucosalis TaxID=202 RepID=UPI0004D4CA78|nr:rhodanese-like domain-containing protein [Campylobacter mucosalis]KEA45881.1 hypothetical protein CR66_05630 [Campylobacter mucosalis]QKF62413.1 putative rhodanese-related sulfurtransferase (tandem rhodanese domains) [Campylobacter mucosalis]
MKFFKSIVVPFALLALFAGCSQSQAVSQEKISGADLAKIEADNKAKENYLVIDVRSQNEYSEGHLKHAINIPVGELESRLDELNGYQDKDIIVYCNQSGENSNSAKAKKILDSKGFKKVNLAQGVKEYNYDLYKFASINAAQFNKISSNPDVLIIDVRKKEDYENAHMKGAINIPDGEPIENYKEILNANKDKILISHCYSGNRSAKLSEILQKEGFKAYNLLDGTKEHNYELVK